MRHFHGPIETNEPSRLADWAIRILVTAICLACSLGWGCYRDPCQQVMGWMGNGAGRGYGNYERGGQVHRDFEAAAAWCEQVHGQEPGTATADCIEEAMFE